MLLSYNHLDAYKDEENNMSTQLTTKERFNEYLINLLIDEYNSQFNIRLNAADFSIRKIPNNASSAIAYEVKSEALGNFKIRTYLTIGNVNDLGPFQPMLNDSFAIGALGDEIMVSYGVMDVQGIKNEGFNIKSWLNSTNEFFDILLLEDFGYIMLEDGSPIVLEEAA